MEIDSLSGIVVDECIKLHREIGPGLFENVYEAVLAGRLERRGLKVARQFPVPVEIDGQIFDPAFRVGILVENRLVLEIKAVERLSQTHIRQVLTYLRLLKQLIWLLLIFSHGTMMDGIRRVSNDHNSR